MLKRFIGAEELHTRVLSDKGLRILGLCIRAKKAFAGTRAVKDCIAGGRTKLVILAADGSQREKKEILYLCEKKRILTVEAESKAVLGRTAGREAVLCVAVVDEDFRNGIVNNTVDGGA